MTSKLHYYRKLNGKAVPQSGEKPLRDIILEYLEKFKENELFTVVIKPYKAQRSNPQNRYMHYAFNLVADHYGYEMEDVKELMKDKFLGYEEVEIAGQIIKKLKSTTDLNTEQQEIFMDKVRRFWLEFDGFIIPLPNEIDLEE